MNEVPSFDMVMEVEEAYVQREIPGMEHEEPSLKLVLVITHNERVKVEKVVVFNEELRLKKNKKGYTATFEKDALLTFKGTEVLGTLFHSIDDSPRQLPITFEIKEDLYLP